MRINSAGHSVKKIQSHQSWDRQPAPGAQTGSSRNFGTPDEDLKGKKEPIGA